MAFSEYNFSKSTMTTAGSGVSGFDAFFDFADKLSPLGNADAESCADFCLAMFSDYTRKITMQICFMMVDSLL